MQSNLVKSEKTQVGQGQVQLLINAILINANIKHAIEGAACRDAILYK